jgi:uncharacterized protein involved in exopolysaccharide biosynthesis
LACEIIFETICETIFMEERRGAETTTESVIPPVQDSDIVIDGSLLRELALRRLRSWLLLGPVIFAAVMGVQLFLMPQTYTATVSVSVQQPTPSAGGSSALVLLGGAAAGAKKYIGILHSRMLAEKVERKYHLREFYKLPYERRAVDLLVDSVKPEDSATDGLLFLKVTLSGPPRFARDPERHRDKAKRLVADVANEYIAQLMDYYSTSDNDRDSVLLNAANEELQRARADYDRSSAAIRTFISDLRNTDSLSAPGSVTEGPAAGGGNGLETLYDQLIRIEAQIRGAEAAEATEDANKLRQLNGVTKLPPDDPFLARARRDLDEATVTLENLRNAYQLGEDNPRVVIARKRVRIAQDELNRQIKGYHGGLTTERLEADTRLKSLQAQRDSIQASIRQAESKLPVRRERTTALLELEKEQEITLTVLKATEQRAAELRLTAPSAKSRLSVVDSAIPPEGGQPGLARAGLVAAFLTVLLFFPTLMWDYRRQARRRNPLDQELAGAAHTNGGSR